MRYWFFASSVCVAFTAIEGRAQAQDAGADCMQAMREDFEFFPAAGSANVALNAPIKVRFPSGIPADLSIELIDTSTQLALDAPRELLAEDTVVLLPAELLSPNTAYEVVVGIEEASFSFTTGTTEDAQGPAFDFQSGVYGLDVQRATSDVACEPGDVRLDVAFLAATDDHSEGDIEYLLYLTRATGLAAPELRAQTRHTGTDIVMSMRLTAEEARDPVCLTALAIDGTGKVSPGSAAVCMDPRAGTYFNGLCSADPLSAAKSRSSAPTGWLLGAACWLLVFYRKH